jgi:hypothetical protein
VNVYIVYPTPGAVTIDAEILALLRAATSMHGVRLNLDWRNPEWRQIVDVASAHGAVLPILDDETDPGYVDVRKPDEFVNWCASAVQEYRFPVVEILNEPKTIPTHTMSAETYADTVNRVGTAIHAVAPETRVAVACEALKAGGTADRSRFWTEVRARLDDTAYELCAIHPYRYHPDRPSWTRTHWPQWAQGAESRLASLARRTFGTGSRAAEHEKWLEAAGKLLVVTETGWNVRDGVTEAQQAQYVTEELDFYRKTGMEIVCLYAYIDDPPDELWGLLRSDKTPRPAAGAVQAWIARATT